MKPYAFGSSSCWSIARFDPPPRFQPPSIFSDISAWHQVTLIWGVSPSTEQRLPFVMSSRYGLHLCLFKGILSNHSISWPLVVGRLIQDRATSYGVLRLKPWISHIYIQHIYHNFFAPSPKLPSDCQSIYELRYVSQVIHCRNNSVARSSSKLGICIIIIRRCINHTVLPGP